MKKIVLLSFFCFCVLLLSASPFKIIDEGNDYLILRFELPEYEISALDDFSMIDCHGASILMKEGLPQLPFFSALISIPEDGGFQLSFSEKKADAINGVNIYPAEKTELINGMPKSIYHYDSNMYQSHNWYPSNLYEKQQPAYYRDNYFSALKFYPFRFKPATQELEIIDSIVIRIDFLGSDQAINTGRYSAEDKSIFLNEVQAQRWIIERAEVEYEDQWRFGDEVEAIQFLVDEEGIYRIDYAYLTETLQDYELEHEIEINWALNWDELDPRYLEMYNENGPVPIHFSGEADGSFDQGDYIEFYGNRHFGDADYYDDFTSENVYTLRMVDHPGSRLAVENGGIQVTDPADYIDPVAFEQTLHFEEENKQDLLGAQFSYNSNDYYKEDIYFWDQISAPNLNLYPFDLQYPYQSNIRRFNAKVSLFGSTFNPDNYDEINHHAIVRINSTIINNIEWAGQREQIFENEEPIPNSYLIDGENTLYVSLPGVVGVENEQVLLDYLDITYWREYKTADNYLKFSKPSTGETGLYQFTLQNFTNDEISVYKIGASIMENVQVVGSEMNAPFTVTFQDMVISDDIRYIALTEDQKKLPKLIRPDFNSQLKNPGNYAEYLIITGEQFKESDGTMQLQDIWESQGVSTSVISVQDIYDEFNNGIESVEAIRDFIQYAYNYWSGEPVKYVLLLGDGILDERDDITSRKYNIIPFRRVWVDKRGAIASDNWIGCIVGDDPVADVSISRINIWEEDQIVDIAEKTQHYLENRNFGDFWHSSIILAAGGNPSEGTYFAKQSERIRKTYIPDHFRVNRIYCNTEDIPDSYHGNTTSLISNINDGSLFVQFMGHGGGYVWADYNLLNKADIATFNNENYPFVASLSCYGSAFNYPQSSCVGEELILAPGKGAIAHVGFTGYGYKMADEVFGNYLSEGMFVNPQYSIGNVLNYTKAKFYGDYGAGAIGIALIHGCALLGDARAELILPELDNDVELNSYIFNVGDTLKMSSSVDPDISQGKFIIYDEDDVQISLNDYYPFTLPVVDQTITAADFIIPESSDQIYSRKVRFFTAGENRETTSLTTFSVGQSAMAEFTMNPTEPTYEDSIMLAADFFDEDGIASVQCRIDNQSDIELVHISGNHFQLSQKITPQNPGTELSFDFLITDVNGDITSTEKIMYTVRGIDLYLQSSELITEDGILAMHVNFSNIGSMDSYNFTCQVWDYSAGQEMIASDEFDAIEAGASATQVIELPLLSGVKNLEIGLNPFGSDFPELNYFNNSVSLEETEYNYFALDQHEITIESLDNNLSCRIPGGIFEDESLVYLNANAFMSPVNQPDINKLMLQDGSNSKAYEIGFISQSSNQDSTDYLPDGFEIEMCFRLYEEGEKQNLKSAMSNHSKRNVGNYTVYRWNDDFDKWIKAGGQYLAETNEIIYISDRLGYYTVLENLDEVAPDIDINVEGQEFTYGGYISSKGVISFLLSDANGIDIFSDQLKVLLDGEVISSSDYTVSPTYGNLTGLPVKYQLDEDKGDHYITIQCTDVNGNYNYRDIEFKVNDEFDLINVANYPNPVKLKTIDIVNSGRTRFTYVLTDDADDVYLKVYTVSGRLIKTFKGLPSSVGYHEYPRTVYGWDCKDEKGFDLANGVYFYRLTAKKGSKKIEKICKLAILK